MAGRQVLIVDPKACTGCYSCVLACSMFHEKVFDPTKSRIRILKNESTCLAIPGLCEQCDESPCINACSFGALERGARDSIIKVDLEKCTGCGACESVCSYAGVKIDGESNLPLICDLCGGDPRCAEICVPQGAIKYLEDAPVSLKKELASCRVKLLASLHFGGGK